MDIKAIQAISICTHRFDDQWAWHYERSGVFSVRMAYHMLADTERRREAWLFEKASYSQHEREEKEWVSLWKAKVPGKIRVFLWRLAKILF
jgi:hypothetical protein